MGFLGDIYRDALPREYPSDSADSAITAIESAQSPDNGTEMTLPGEHATGEQGTTTSAAAAGSLAVFPSVTNTLQRDSEAMAQSRVEAQAVPTAPDSVIAGSAETPFAQIKDDHAAPAKTAVDIAEELAAAPQAGPATLSAHRAPARDMEPASDIQSAGHISEHIFHSEPSHADPVNQDMHHPAVSDSVIESNTPKETARAVTASPSAERASAQLDELPMSNAGDPQFITGADPFVPLEDHHARMTTKSNRSELIESTVHPAAAVQVNSPSEAPADSTIIAADHSITTASAVLHTDAGNPMAVAGHPDSEMARQSASAPLAAPTPVSLPVPPEERTGSIQPVVADMGSQSEARHATASPAVESIAPGVSLNRQDNSNPAIHTATSNSLLPELKSNDREPTAVSTGVVSLQRAGSEIQPQASQPVMATAIRQALGVASVASARAEAHPIGGPAIASSAIHTALPDNVVTHATSTQATAKPSLPSTPATPVAYEARQHAALTGPNSPRRAGLDAGRATASQRGGVHIGQVEVTVLAPAPPQTTTAPRRGTTPGGLSLASRYFLRGF